jgi:flagellar hook-associated protein 1 FlgK
VGLNSILEIGKSGLNIFSVAQEVTGENIANVNTPGYSRQRVLLESAPPVQANGFPLGTGVKISTVERYYDGLLQNQLINAQTTQGFDTTKSTVLQQIEPSFNEVSNDGLGAAITKFFSSWQDLTLNPAGTAERQAVLSSTQVLTDNFKAVSTTLTNAISGQNDALPPLTDGINATLKNIAALNGQIKTTELVSGNANEIRDQRDQLIRDLSQQIGITTKENSDGSTDVNFADTGAALVTGATAGAFSLDKTTNPASYAVMLTPAGAAGTPPVAVTPVTGQLGATLYLRDNTTGGIPSYLNKLNSLASTIVSEVNTQHKLGYDLSGTTTGANFFSSAGTTAATISLDAGITGTDKIAASGVINTLGDNSNALALAQLQGKKTMSLGTATFGSYYNALVSSVGQDVQSAKNSEAQDVAFTKQLTTLRESNSGVSLDEELTNLVKYQRSYQASAKLITTATEMMDVVMGIIR